MDKGWESRKSLDWEESFIKCMDRGRNVRKSMNRERKVRKSMDRVGKLDQTNFYVLCFNIICSKTFIQ